MGVSQLRYQENILTTETETKSNRPWNSCTIIKHYSLDIIRVMNLLLDGLEM